MHAHKQKKRQGPEKIQSPTNVFSISKTQDF